jgi:hypothetical protein
MADDEFEKEEYGDAKVGIEDSAIQTRISDLVKTPSCNLGECTAKVVEPAEEAWLRLMSAVPKIGQTANIAPARDIKAYALPSGESVASLVASLRPSPADEYSIEQIADEWQTFYTELYNVPEDLKTGLSTLSEDWDGDDYDAFEEQVEKVIKNCRTILEDVWGEDGGAVKVLNDKAEEIFSQQGGNECVYPAPKFHLEDAAACSHKIHIRPAYFPECKVFADDETKTAMEWAGFEPGIIDEVEENRQAEYDYWIEQTNAYPDLEIDGRKGADLAQYKADEYAKTTTDSLGTDGQEQLQDQAKVVNGDIMDRKTNTNVQVSEIKPQAKNSEQTTFNNGDVPPTPDLDGGAPPGGGTPPGLGDMTPPGSPTPINPPSTPTPTPTDPGGLDPYTPPDSSLPDNGSLDDENPWDSSVPDPDDISGGLASGGGGGGLGGGLGGGPGGGMGGGLGGGAGGGAGGGLGGGLGAGGAMGGMMGGAGGGRGMGAGAGGGRGAGAKGMGKGMGAGGRGMAGGMMGGAGGGRGMGGQGEGEQETGTWLTEDDDVWGIGNEDSDPYA